jgi:hypothetical protein
MRLCNEIFSMAIPCSLAWSGLVTEHRLDFVSALSHRLRRSGDGRPVVNAAATGPSLARAHAVTFFPT